MKFFKKFNTSRLWTGLQFFALVAAMLIPLLSKDKGARTIASIPGNSETQLVSNDYSKPLPKAAFKSSSSPRSLSSGVLSLPDVRLEPRVVLLSKSRQVRFEKISRNTSRSPASVGKDSQESYRLVKIRKRVASGDCEDLPLILNGVGKRQPIGSVYIELVDRESVFWADYMDPKGKIVSQEIRVRKGF